MNEGDVLWQSIEEVMSFIDWGEKHQIVPVLEELCQIIIFLISDSINKKYWIQFWFEKKKIVFCDLKYKQLQDIICLINSVQFNHTLLFTEEKKKKRCSIKYFEWFAIGIVKMK